MRVQVHVRHEGYPVHLIDDEWRCQHSNVEVTPPCCSPFQRIIECACQGMYSVYCPDCNNKDMRDYEIENIIEGSL
jgi:hypothetical protein